MTQVTLNIPDSEFDFFMKLIQKFNYTTVKEEDILDERRATESTSTFLTSPLYIPTEPEKAAIEEGYLQSKRGQISNHTQVTERLQKKHNL
jgi:hypothetical protein